MKTMPRKLFIALVLPALLLTLNLRLSTAFAQGTAFTYQGRLNDGANPANGSYDLRFILYDNSVGGSQQGPILTNNATAVSDGLFSVTLDFGNQFPGAGRWLELAVRTNGPGTFSILSPRQALTPTPYALTAGNVISGGLASGTYGNAVTLNNPTNQFTGSFSGNGGGLTNLSAAGLAGTVADARLSSNVALLSRSGQVFTGSSNSFIGLVGLGTSAPQANLHVVTGASGEGIRVQGPGSGAMNQAYLSFMDNGGTRIGIVGDGSTYDSDVFLGADSGDVVLSTAAGRVVTVTAAGNVGIGTTTPDPSYQLEVNGNMFLSSYLRVGSGPLTGFNLGVSDSAEIGNMLEVDTNLYVLWGDAYKPGGGSWSVSSDFRLKKDIQPLAGVLDQLLKLRGVSFEYTDPGKIHELSGRRIGMVAQEVEKVFPDWVSTGADGYKRLSYRGFEALTVEALRELRQEKNEELQAVSQKLADRLKRQDEENVELKQKNQSLEKRLEVLEQVILKQKQIKGVEP